jgi:hypothetical protein
LQALSAPPGRHGWESRERRRAEQRFNDIRQLASAFLFDVHDAIQDLPGSTPARRLLVSNALEYLDKLAQDAGGVPELQRELAAAYVTVGVVQGRPLNPNLGDTPGALASYKKAAALYEALQSQPAADAASRRGLATTYIRPSEILSSSGDMAEALAFARNRCQNARSRSRGARQNPGGAGCGPIASLQSQQPIDRIRPGRVRNAKPERSMIGGRWGSEMTHQEIQEFFATQQEHWRGRDPLKLAKGHAEDGTIISPIFRTVTGGSAILASYRTLFEIFPDWDYHGERLLIDGSSVAEPFSVTATHVGEFMGLLGTGRRFELQGVRLYYDFTGLLIQLGVLRSKPA